MFISRWCHLGIILFIEGRLEAKLPTIWTDEKALQLGRRSDMEKMSTGKDAGARKGREVAKHCFFPVFCGSGGSKSRLAKAAGAETSGQMRDTNLHAVCGAKHTVSKDVEITPCSGQFWTSRCRPAV